MGIVVFFSELVKLLVDRGLAGVVYVGVRLMYEQTLEVVMSKRKTDMSRRTMYISEAIWSRLEKLATVRGTTVSDLVRLSILELLERVEK